MSMICVCTHGVFLNTRYMVFYTHPRFVCESMIGCASNLFFCTHEWFVCPMLFVCVHGCCVCSCWFLRWVVCFVRVFIDAALIYWYVLCGFVKTSVMLAACFVFWMWMWMCSCSCTKQLFVHGMCVFVICVTACFSWFKMKENKQ